MVAPLRVLFAVALGGVLSLAGCVVEPCAGRDDILSGPGGLDVLEEEHAAGWGKDACTQCHALETTHRYNCTSEPDMDLEAVQDEAEEGTYEACAGCHGDNGVDP